MFLKDIIIDNSIISITDVKLSRDIKLANIHISIFSSGLKTSSEIMDLLIIRKKEIKFKMGIKLKSKFVPDLKFHLDNSMQSYDEINILLKK